MDVLGAFRAEVLAQNPGAADALQRLTALVGTGGAGAPADVRAQFAALLPSVTEAQLVAPGAPDAALSAAKDVLARLRAEVEDPASTLFTASSAAAAAGSATSRVPAAGAGAGAGSNSSASNSSASSSSSSAAAAPAATYTARDELARKEEEAGALQFRVVRNDGVRQHMIWLTQVKNIFATQLPKMPREYIARLVFDRKHRSLLAIKRDRVVGGICFRPFVPQRFGEIAFCAITSSEQVKGYGTRLMNHLKEAVKLDGLTHFLTYADNYAIGYFRKQGFTKAISMPPERWVGYIKDYDGGTLMECVILSNVDYLDVPGLVARQRAAVLAAIGARPAASVVHPPLDFSDAATGGDADFYLKNAGRIPGLKESGYNPNAVITRKRDTVDRAAMAKPLEAFVSQLVAHDDSWPFRDPVDTSVVPDYLTIVSEPIDLGTIKKQAVTAHYRSLEHFLLDVNRVFDNCRKYNRPDTEYVACANKLQTFVKSRLPGLQAAVAATQPPATGVATRGAAASASASAMQVDT